MNIGLPRVGIILNRRTSLTFNSGPARPECGRSAAVETARKSTTRHGAWSNGRITSLLEYEAGAVFIEGKNDHPGSSYTDCTLLALTPRTSS
jgi:hypothetical protein